MLGYLVSPNKQFVTKDGAPMTAGHLEVFLYETDDRATTYSDFNWTLNPADIAIDANGRAPVIADDGTTYRIEVYDASGALQWTVSPAFAGGDGAVAEIIADLSGCVRADVEQSFTDAQKALARENIGAVSIEDIPDDQVNADWDEDDPGSKSFIENKPDLSKFVRADIEQNFTDVEKAQALKNISAEEYRGNQFDIVQNHLGTGKYCKIAELTREGDRRDSCFYYFTLCLKFVVNFDSSTESGIENGTFLFSAVDYDRLNDYEDGGQWLEYDNAFAYNRLSQCIKGVHILRQKTGLKVDRYEIWLEVDDTIFNIAGSISVDVIENVGSWAYNGQTSRSDRGMKAGWFKVYDATQTGQPMLLQTTIDTLTDSTFVEAVRKPQIAVIDNLAPLAEAEAIVQKGDIPFMKFGASYAWPYVMFDSVQAWVLFNSNFLQIQNKVDGHCETITRFILYREERTNFTIEATGESLLGKINDPSNWDNPNAPGLEIDMYRESTSDNSYTMRAYWKKGDTSDPAPTKEFQIVVKEYTLPNALSCRVYTYTKTLSPTSTDLRTITTTTMPNVHEIEVEFKEPNNSHTYKLVCNMFFGQSRFIDMGYGY